MSEKSSEKSPERKGVSIEEVRQRLGMARDKIAQIREEQTQARQALAKEIVDMAEGNKRLSQANQNQGEFNQGYREAERKKEEGMNTLRVEVQRGKEELTSLSQEIERIKTELKRDSSLNVDLPSEEDLQGIREAITEGEQSLKTLQKEYQALMKRHHEFQEAQEEFARNPVKSASDTVFWAYEEMTKKRLNKEEREALIREREEALGRALTKEEALLLIEEREALTKKSLSAEERNAIAQEVQQETQKRSQAEQTEHDKVRKKEIQKEQEKEVTSYESTLANIKAEYQAYKQKTEDRVKAMEEELTDEIFLEGINTNWTTLEKTRDLLGKSPFGRLVRLTNKESVEKEFRRVLDDIRRSYDEKLEESRRIRQDLANYMASQTRPNLYRYYTEHYRGGIDAELDARVEKLRSAQEALVNEMQDFVTNARSRIFQYQENLNRVFREKDLKEIRDFSNHLYSDYLRRR